MNFDERIAIVHGCFFSNKENVHFKAIDKLITEIKLRFDFQGGPVSQANHQSFSSRSIVYWK
jgi:hypothetical protein